MSTELLVTLAAFFLAAGVAGLAIMRANRPAEPMKPPLIDYHYIAIPALVALLVIGAHLATLIAGHAITGNR